MRLFIRRLWHRLFGHSPVYSQVLANSALTGYGCSRLTSNSLFVTIATRGTPT